MKNKFYWKRFSAFTLAEVLIVIGIIGIIAEFTIPTLVNNIQNTEFKVAYKKAYSTASQAWLKAVNDDLITSRPDWADGATRVSNFEGFMSEFKVVKKCFDGNAYDCWNKNGDFYYQGNPGPLAPAFIDASGMVWAINSRLNGSGAELLVDTNGDKKPNQFGVDRFLFAPKTSDNQFVGLPVKLVLFDDFTTYDINVCPSGTKHPCYYTSWITGSK